MSTHTPNPAPPPPTHTLPPDTLGADNRRNKPRCISIKAGVPVVVAASDRAGRGNGRKSADQSGQHGLR